MCEYCGCQGLSILTSEHDRMLDYVRSAESAAGGADVGAARAACDQLRRLMRPHTAVEEQALFPALDAEFGAQMHDLVDEHRALDVVLEAMTAAADPDPGWAQRLEDAMSALRGHIRKEQDGVFPAALSRLTPQQWSHLDQVRARVGSELVPARN